LRRLEVLPISLSLEGLNSYAEKVEIDFRRFHKNKLFGIFGDTGAGKSTILDAIILAIYGEIPRLGSRHRQEAINPLKQTARLTFSFSVRDGSREKEYLIERTIGKHSTCRLYELEDGVKKPKAEKEVEFQKAIKHIIGLSSHEFCKVVVLPQNQFAKMLELSPAERADILGNLFGVNVYGEPLWEVVTDIANKTQQDISRIEGRLEELKNISEEAVLKKEQEMREAEETLKAKVAQKKRLEEELQRVLRFVQLQKDRENIERTLSRLEQMAPQIEEMKQKVRADEELSECKSLYYERKTLQASIAKHLKELEDAQSAYKTVEQELQEVLARKEDFQSSYLAKQEELIRKETEARHAMELKNSLAKMEHESKKIHDEISLNEQQLKQTEKEIQGFVKEIADLNDRKANIEKKLAEVRLTEEEREKHDLLLKNQSKLNELKTLEAEVQRLVRKQGEEKKDRDLLCRKIADFVFTNLGLKVQSPSETGTVLDAKKKELEEEVARKRQEQKELELKDLAVTLSSRLLPGQPCPVCGSTEHPKPASGEVGEVLEKTKQEIKELEQRLSVLEDSRNRLNPLLKRLIEVEARLQRAEEDIKEKTNLLMTLKEEMSRVFSDEVILHSERILSALDQRRKHAENLMSELNELNNELEQKRDLVNKQEQKKAEIVATLQHLKAQYEKIRNDISTIRDEINLKTKGQDPEGLIKVVATERKRLEKTREALEKAVKDKENETKAKAQELERMRTVLGEMQKRCGQIEDTLRQKAKEKDVSIEEMERFFLDDAVKQQMKMEIENFQVEWNKNLGALSQVKKRIEELGVEEISPDEPSRTEEQLKIVENQVRELQRAIGRLEDSLRRDRESLEQKSAMLEEYKRLEKALGNITTLQGLIRGKDMVEFVSAYYMRNIVHDANEIIEAVAERRLRLNYSKDGDLSVKDLFYNTERRVATLSGGETFLVSFALALALSNYIQHSKGKAIHFFFVDEGFSSLDQDLLDSLSTVIDKLRSQDKLVGLISHLQEMKQMIPEHIFVYRDATGTSKIRYGTSERF
jgi:exonuclease SbcC